MFVATPTPITGSYREITATDNTGRKLATGSFVGVSGAEYKLVEQMIIDASPHDNTGQKRDKPSAWRIISK